MSRRIDIELTSARSDGSWTWRAAGAREPRGVLEGSILPAGAKVGDELKVEVEQEIDGITVQSVVSGRAKADRNGVLELLPSEQPFEPVTQQRVHRDRDERREGRRDGRREGRRDGRRDGRSGPPEGETRQREARPPRDRRERPGGGGEHGERPERRQRARPSFTPPPELPQRPKPKRLRPGKAHRTEVLSRLPEEQRPIAELALQGMAAVRQRLKDDNKRLAAEGKAVMPEASVLKLAEELLPGLRVAEWLDRAEAASRQIEHLDLRDLRSVVASADDPMVARDESTRELVAELKAALVRKQDQELQLWFGDIDAALGVGRVIRALRLSSQPPKAGVPFPGELAHRLAEAASASLTPADGADRWAALLEAAAFSPVRQQIVPVGVPESVSDELRATITRLGPAMPQVAAKFGIELPPGAPMPKPLRPAPRPKAAKAAPRPAPKQPARPAAPAAEPAPQPEAEAAPEPEAAPAAEPAPPPEAAPEPAAAEPEAAPEPSPEPEAAPEAAAAPQPQPVAEADAVPDAVPEAEAAPPAVG